MLAFLTCHFGFNLDLFKIKTPRTINSVAN